MDVAADPRRYRASRYLQLMTMDDTWVFAAHALLGNRRVYHRSGTELLTLFQQPRRLADGVEEARTRGIIPPPPDGGEDALARQVALFLMELVTCRFLVPEDDDEPALVLAEVKRRFGADLTGAMALGAMEDMFEPVLPRRLDQPGTGTGVDEVSFLLLGWCFTQSVRPLLAEEARTRGLVAHVHVGFHDDHHLVDSLQPDVTVLQTSHRMVLAPLLDGFHATTPRERHLRVKLAAEAVVRAVREVRHRAAGKLVLVQGVALPQTSPLGMREHRDVPGMRACLTEVNVAAASACAESPATLFVDEDALLSAWGKRWVLDDLVSTYSHHGVLGFDADNPGHDDRLKSFGVKDRLLLHRILARAYVDHLVAWRGQDQVRVIAVDLDNTLWPGEMGDDTFSLADDHVALSLMYGAHGGLHEALRIIRDRGILLAVVSRNAPEVVLRKWRMDDVPEVYRSTAADARHFLRPDDFVRLKIGWGRKSDSLRELLSELQVKPRQVCFIDDNPVERAEVAQAFPDMMILGEDLNRVREALLTDPRFQPLTDSEEARTRTETTRARLQREDAEAAAPDHAAFLRSLKVRCRAGVLHDVTRAARITELFQRTTQFNTTGVKPTAAEVEALIRDGAHGAVVAMWVTDRFADYGLVGAALVEGGVLRCVAMSCRVLGVEAERALFREAVRAAARHASLVHLPYVPAPDGRNLPAERLFTIPGVERVTGGGRYDVGRHGLPPLPEHVTAEELA